MLNRLVRLLNPLKDESFSGFLTRLCWENHYSTPSYLYKEIMQRYPATNPNIIGDISFFNKVYQLTGVKNDQLEKMIIMNKGEGHYLFPLGQDLKRYMVQSKGTKICPLCLEQFGFQKITWELTSVTVCTDHQILLIDQCTNCGHTIPWLRSNINRCPCGKNLATIKGKNVGSEEVLLSKVITKYCDITKIDENLYKNVPVSNLELLDFLRVIFFIAGQYEGINDTTGKFIGTINNNLQIHNLLIKANKALSNWPDDKVFERCHRESVSCKLDTGIKKDFGAFYRMLFNDFSEDKFQFLRESFCKYIENWCGGYLTVKNKIKGVNQNYLSETTAAKKLGISPVSVKILLESGYIRGKIAKSGAKHLVLIDPKSIEEYLKELEGAWSLHQAAKILGIGHEIVADLSREGVLKAFKGPSIDRSPIWMVEKNSVYSLIEKFEERVSGEQGNELTLKKVIRKASSAGISLKEIIQNTIKKIIVPSSICKNKIGLLAFNYNEKQIKKFVIDIRSINIKELSVLDVAGSLHLKQEVASLWMDKGFIKSRMIPGKKIKRLTDKKSLEQFLTEYIPASALAKRHGTSSNSLVKKYICKGINPVSGPLVDGGRQYLFCLDDINKLEKR